MRVFVAGATGVLGRRIVELLVHDGHQVTATTRRAEKLANLRARGADAIILDVLDAAVVAAAVAKAAPDVLMNQVTDLSDGVGRGNAAVRVQGSANLAAAATTAGTRRVIAQSIAWAYGPGEEPAWEDERLDTDAPDRRGATVRGIRTLEEVTSRAPEWVALRYGMLYGPGTWFAPGGERADAAHSRGLVSDADVTSFVHADDAARAAVAALQWPNGAVNVCDDEPAPATAWVPNFCVAVGAPEPPLPAVRERTPWARGANNSLLRSTLRFDLAYPSWRLGFASMNGVPRRGCRRPDSGLQ